MDINFSELAFWIGLQIDIITTLMKKLCLFVLNVQF